MWREFHKMVDKCTSIRDLCERLVWASQHLLQTMMKSKWKSRRKQWCLAPPSLLEPIPTFLDSHYLSLGSPDLALSSRCSLPASTSGLAFG